jgi:creatinine amidohydrolase
MKCDANTVTWPEVKQHVQHAKLAVLAFGALEQHGYHLPLSTDTVMASALAARLADSLNALLLPSIPYGECWNNTGFPGTVSLSASTVEAIVIDIGKGLTDFGIQVLVIVNGHFGNRGPIELAARQLRDQHDLAVLMLNYPGLEEIANTLCESKPAAPGFYHADEVETSVMLTLAPETVQMNKARAEYPIFPETWGAEAIRLDTFCASGVFGDPRPATGEKGAQILDAITSRALSVIQAFLERQFPASSPLTGSSQQHVGKTHGHSKKRNARP